MTAVDTNVLVRLLTGDDPKQTATVRSLFVAEPIWIAKTALIETGWVLRGFENRLRRNSSLDEMKILTIPSPLTAPRTTTPLDSAFGTT